MNISAKAGLLRVLMPGLVTVYIQINTTAVGTRKRVPSAVVYSQVFGRLSVFSQPFDDTFFHTLTEYQRRYQPAEQREYRYNDEYRDYREARAVEPEHPLEQPAGERAEYDRQYQRGSGGA